MPTYDYLCPNGHRFEVIHSVTGPAPESCPVCGAAPVRKAFSAPSIHFKGSGWAKKDRSTSSRPAAAASASEDGSSGGSGDKSPATEGSPAASEKTAATDGKDSKRSKDPKESSNPTGTSASGTAATAD